MADATQTHPKGWMFSANRGLKDVQPPGSSQEIITEAGDNITTEAGERLLTEN